MLRPPLRNTPGTLPLICPPSTANVPACRRRKMRPIAPGKVVRPLPPWDVSFLGAFFAPVVRHQRFTTKTQAVNTLTPSLRDWFSRFSCVHTFCWGRQCCWFWHGSQHSSCWSQWRCCWRDLVSSVASSRWQIESSGTPAWFVLVIAVPGLLAVGYMRIVRRSGVHIAWSVLAFFMIALFPRLRASTPPFRTITLWQHGNASTIRPL